MLHAKDGTIEPDATIAYSLEVRSFVLSTKVDFVVTL